MQAITLHSKHLSASVKANGAELCSLILKNSNRELLWQAEKAWERHAPNLFPIVGKLKDNTLVHQGKKYPMNQHGFARDLPFEVTSQSENSCTLTLEANEKTRAQYPFEFRFDVTYTLTANTLKVSYQITNPSDETLPANVGAHPAFIWPLEEDVKAEDHTITFEHDEPAPIRRLNEGLLKLEKFESPVQGKVSPLARELFKEDAIIMDEIQSRKVIYTAKGAPSIEVSFSDFPYLGIWTKYNENAKFICIEPWNGHASPEEFDGEFTKKPNMAYIPANSNKSWSYSISISE